MGGELGLDLHRFLATDGTGLASDTFADEIDLSYRRSAGAGISIRTGLSYVMAGDGGIETGVVANDQTFFYFQLQAGF